MWGREDYLKEADSQLSDTNIYEKVDFDPSSVLEDVILESINRIREREVMEPDTLQFLRLPILS